jgi:hypothetical protein
MKTQWRLETDYKRCDPYFATLFVWATGCMERVWFSQFENKSKKGYHLE